MDTTSVCWNLTNVCNKSCDYCFRELNEMAQSYETNLKILDRLCELGITRISFSGGEPYLFPNILDLMHETKLRGMQVYVITNGSLLNRNNIEEYLKDVDKVSFSIDSPRGYINEKIGRGRDSYSHIKELLPYIRQIYDKDKLMIDINTVVTCDKHHEYQELNFMVDAIANSLYKYNINKWKIIRFYPLRGKALENKEANWVSNTDFIEIKRIYSGNHYVKIDIRDISDIDDNYVISPCGYLKKSFNGREEILMDLKPSNNEVKGSGRNV